MVNIAQTLRVENGASISVSQTIHQSFFITTTRTLEPFSGYGIEGWYVISTPSADNLALNRDTYTQAFSLLWNTSSDPDLLQEANIDIRHLNKVQNPRKPIANNSTIPAGTWTTVLDPSSQEYYYALVPYLSSQHIYGHLGYFAYLLFLFYNIDNCVFRLSFMTQDISGAVQALKSSTTIADIAAYFPTVGLNSASEANATNFFLPTNAAAENSELYTSYAQYFLNQIFSINDNLMDINFSYFFKLVNLRYMRYTTPNDASNAIANGLAADFPNPLHVTPTGSIETQNLLEHPPILNIGYSLSQLPNSWVDFIIEGFIIHTGSDFGFGSRTSLTTLGALGATATSNYSSAFSTRSQGYPVATIVPGLGVAATSSVTTTQQQTIFTINLEAVLVSALQVTQTFRIHESISITLFVQPQLYFNGGDPNRFSGGKTLTPHITAKNRKSQPDSTNISEIGTSLTSAESANLYTILRSRDAITKAGGHRFGSNTTAIENLFKNIQVEYQNNGNTMNKEIIFGNVQKLENENDSIIPITFGLDSGLTNSVSQSVTTGVKVTASATVSAPPVAAQTVG